MTKWKKRKRGVASRKRKITKQQLEDKDDSDWWEGERKLRRFKIFEEETQKIFDKVIQHHTLSDNE